MFPKANLAIVLPVISWSQGILWFQKSFLFKLKTMRTAQNKLFPFRKKSGQRPNSLFN